MKVVVMIGLLAAATAGFAAGFILHVEIDASEEAACAEEYSYLNENIVCEHGNAIRKTSYYETEMEIDTLIAEAVSHGVSDASVYFRDLRNGPAFGVNERIRFVPASLLKIPVGLVFLHAAIEQPGILDGKIMFHGETLVDEQGVEPGVTAQEGEEYTIRELLEMMLTHSDNASYQALEAFIAAEPSREALRFEAFRELGFIDPDTQETRTLTVRGYSALFSLLHNATYLTPELSNLLLSWLADSPYRAGIVAGVPEGIAVAHKFGERRHDDGRKELHDCGIVYFPENPYVLCVMTIGSDWEAQQALIATISQRIYAEVESRRI